MIAFFTLAIFISDDDVSTDSLLKLWYGEKSSTLPPLDGYSSFDSPSSFTMPTAESERREAPLSPKRSHSPAGQDSLRSCLSQQRQPAAPPPPKDARLSGMRPKSLMSRYTPTYKQAMHQRLLQVPSRMRPRDQSSPILCDSKETPRIKVSTTKHIFVSNQHFV